MWIEISENWTVNASVSVTVPLTSTEVWDSVRDIERYAAVDMFHKKVVLHGPRPRRGTPITLDHRFACFRVRRIGRILRWRPGTGYAFSDLSGRGVRAGFAHIYDYRIEPLTDRRTRIGIVVRGRWTATFLPRFVLQAWLAWIMLKTRKTLENRLLLDAWRRSRQRPPDVANTGPG